MTIEDKVLVPYPLHYKSHLILNLQVQYQDRRKEEMENRLNPASILTRFRILCILLFEKQVNTTSSLHKVYAILESQLTLIILTFY